MKEKNLIRICLMLMFLALFLMIHLQANNPYADIMTAIPTLLAVMNT